MESCIPTVEATLKCKTLTGLDSTTLEHIYDFYEAFRGDNLEPLGRDEIFAYFFYLYTGCTQHVISCMMTLMVTTPRTYDDVDEFLLRIIGKKQSTARGGWAVRTVQDRIKNIESHLGQVLQRRVDIRNNLDIINSPHNTVMTRVQLSNKQHFQRHQAVRGCTDGVPVTCVAYKEAKNANFSGKYKEHCVRFVVICSLTGFSVHVFPIAGSGSSGDGTVLDYNFKERGNPFRDENYPLLQQLKLYSDCGFREETAGGPDETNLIMRPYTKPQLYPRPDPTSKIAERDDEGNFTDEAKEAWKQYKEAFEKKLRTNGFIQFYRSRIEHRFSKAELHRFRALRHWTRGRNCVIDAVMIAFAAINIEKRLSSDDLAGAYTSPSQTNWDNIEPSQNSIAEFTVEALSPS